MSDLLHILRREFVYLWYYFDLQFRQIFWYWVLGIAIGSFISVFFKDGIHGGGCFCFRNICSDGDDVDEF